MVSRLSEIVIDCHDVRREAEFWCAVLGYRIVDEEDGVLEAADWDVADRDALRSGPRPPSLVFVPVSDTVTIKDPVHLDVNPVDRSQAAEVERLLALGARHADVGQGEQRWVVLASPEGHEFCVLGSLHPDG